MSDVDDDSPFDRATDAMARRRWDEAYRLLSAADENRELSADKLPVLAEAAYFAGHPEVSRQAWERVHGSALREGDLDKAAGAALQVSGLLIDAGLFSMFRAWSARAERLLHDQSESTLHGVLSMQRAFIALISGEFAAALELSRRAIEIATRFDDASTLALARIAEARALILEGHMTEGLALLDEAAVAVTSGELDPMATGIVYCSVVCSWQALAEYERAEEWTEVMQRWTGQQHGGAPHGWCRVHKAEILRLRGACREAEGEVLQACEEIRVYAKPDLGWPLNELGQIRLRLGELAQAEEAFRQALETGWEPQPGLALLRLAQGDVDGAMKSIRDALDHPSVEPSWEVPPNTELRRAPRLAAQVDIAIAAGDVESARSAADELQAIANTFGSKALRASAATARGAVQLADSQASEAQRSFQEGMLLWHEIEAPYEGAQARIGAAQAYRLQGNEDRAVLEIQAARSTFERVGAKVDDRKAATLLSVISRHPAASKPEEKVFMFTDIVRSTNLVELIGDEAWAHLVRWHNETIAALVAAEGGEVVRTMGDGFFVTFDTAGEALDCAVAIQRTLERHRREHGFAPWVRIGLHRGEAIREKADWSGVWVHVAARIGALADAEEILVTLDTLEKDESPYATSAQRSVTLKGITGPVEVASVDWR